MGFRDKFKKKKTAEQDLSHKRTELSYQGTSHRVALAHDVDYHPRPSPVQSQSALTATSPSPMSRGRATSPLGSEARNIGQRSRSTSVDREPTTPASTKPTSNQGGNWNPYIAGGAVAVGAFFTPVLAVGAVAAVGFGAAAAGATVIANNMSNNNRAIVESEHRSNVARAAIEAERDVRKHRATVSAQERVATKMVESGRFDNSRRYNVRHGQEFVGGASRSMIEY